MVFVTSGLPSFCQAPTIASFTPTSGPVWSSVVITGTNFSSTPTNNIVFFGATRSTVSAATTTQLTVTVPSGATYQAISVLTNGLMANSRVPFDVTFIRDGSGIDATTFGASMDLVLGTGLSTAGIAIGDLDGDGKADLVATNTSGGTCSVFRNTTSGPISFATNVDFGGLQGIHSFLKP